MSTDHVSHPKPIDTTKLMSHSNARQISLPRSRQTIVTTNQRVSSSYDAKHLAISEQTPPINQRRTPLTMPSSFVSPEQDHFVPAVDHSTIASEDDACDPIFQKSTVKTLSSPVREVCHQLTRSDLTSQPTQAVILNTTEVQRVTKPAEGTTPHEPGSISERYRAEVLPPLSNKKRPLSMKGTAR